MKKLIYTIALILAVSFTVTSCKSETKKDAKEVVEDVKQEMKDAGQEIKKEAHKAGEEMKEAGKDIKEAGEGLKEDAEKALGMTMYQCPMKCEGDKMYDKEGQCPVCKMDLKKVEEHKH